MAIRPPQAIHPLLSTARWSSGAKRVRMSMNDAEVVVFSSENRGCAQLLDNPLVATPQPGFRSFDGD